MRSSLTLASPAHRSKPANGFLLQRKCDCGAATASFSGICNECDARRLQTKLTIGESNDVYEQEADRVAQVVLQSPRPAANAKPPAISPIVQRAGEQGVHSGRSAPPSVDSVLSSPGAVLDIGVRSFFESRFGHDFSNMRMRADREAAKSARAVDLLGHSIARLTQAKRLAPEGRSITLQPKLTIGAANDQYEQEADHVARQVMSMSDTVAANSMQRFMLPEKEGQALQAKPLAASITPFVQRLYSTEEEPEPIQAKSARSLSDSFEAGKDVESQVNQSKGRGSPLPDPVRSYMEPRFGVEFSRVRVHTGSNAIQMNRDIGARAFTHGSDIYFGAGSSPTNLELTAHELTHVVQQTDADGMHVDQSDEKGRPHISTGLVVPGAPVVQRACGEADIRGAVRGRLASIELGDPGVTGTLVRFHVACDEFLSSADETALRRLESSLPARTRIIIHGFASEEGPPMFNLFLSLARAVKVKDVLSSFLDPAQIERVVMHGAVPGAHPDRRSVIIETKAPLPLVTKTLNIVSWISERGLPDFSKVNLALDPPSIRVGDAACMALKCTANPAPPTTLPPSSVSAFIASKQYRAFQTYTITHSPSTSPRGFFSSAQIVGFTAPSSCSDIPPTTFQMGEISPLNHATPNMSGMNPQAEALMKFRVSATEESAAIKEATTFPGSMLFSTRMLRHVPWVWTQTSLRLEARTGLLNWAVQGSAFPMHTIYLDGTRVAEIPQGPCGVVVASRFRTADMPRQTMAEEAKQVSVPISGQEETVDPGGTVSGSG